MRSASRVVEVRAQEHCDYASIVTISNVSGSAVRNRDVNRDHPRARRPSDHRPSRTLQPGRQQRPETRPPGERGHRARVAPTTSTASDPRPYGNVSGTAVRDRDAPIGDFFPKKKRSDPARQQLATASGPIWRSAYRHWRTLFILKSTDGSSRAELRLPNEGARQSKSVGRRSPAGGTAATRRRRGIIASAARSGKRVVACRPLAG
jgi:hypothetical protein